MRLHAHPAHRDSALGGTLRDAHRNVGPRARRAVLRGGCGRDAHRNVGHGRDAPCYEEAVGGTPTETWATGGTRRATADTVNKDPAGD
jgi:hypothetical protein